MDGVGVGWIEVDGGVGGGEEIGGVGGVGVGSNGADDDGVG